MRFLGCCFFLLCVFTPYVVFSVVFSEERALLSLFWVSPHLLRFPSHLSRRSHAVSSSVFLVPLPLSFCWFTSCRGGVLP